MNLINDFRMLWTDITVYLRGYAISAVNGLDKLKEATRIRVYHIAEHFASKLEPFFGDDISAQFQELMLQFLINIMELIDAYVTGDEAAINQALPPVYKDISDISAFLAEINSYWNSDELESLLTKLFESGLAGLAAIKAEDYEQDFQIIDSNLRYATMMGDYMTNGLLAYLQPAKT
jgi:hypothetical protein